MLSHTRNRQSLDQSYRSRPAKLGRVKTSRFTRTTKMRHPSTYDDARRCDKCTCISRQFIIIITFYYQIAVVIYVQLHLFYTRQCIHSYPQYTIVVLYNYTVQHIKMAHKMCKHLQNELLDALFQNRSLIIAVNKINRGESVCTKQSNSSKRLVIGVIINQNKVHVCPTIIIMLGWSEIKNHNSKSKIVFEFGRRIPMSILLNTQILSYLMSHFNIFTECWNQQ